MNLKHIEPGIWKRATTVLMLIMLLIIIYGQVKLISLVVSHYQDLNTDPFAFGARKYSINQCSCVVDATHLLYFNQSESKFIVSRPSQKAVSDNYSLHEYSKYFIQNGTG